MLKRNRNLDSKIVALGDGMEMKLIKRLTEESYFEEVRDGAEKFTPLS